MHHKLELKLKHIDMHNISHIETPIKLKGKLEKKKQKSFPQGRKNNNKVKTQRRINLRS